MNTFKTYNFIFNFLESIPNIRYQSYVIYDRVSQVANKIMMKFVVAPDKEFFEKVNNYIAVTCLICNS